MRLIRAILITVIISIAVPLGGYVPCRVTTTAGPAFERWGDAAFPISWRLNSARGSNVGGERGVVDVVRLAFQAWSNLATSRVGFTGGLPATATNAAQDNVNLISLVPTTYSSDAPSLTILYTVTTPAGNQFPGQIKVPPYVYLTQERFAVCPSCDRAYWHGTHADQMLKRLRAFPT